MAVKQDAKGVLPQGKERLLGLIGKKVGMTTYFAENGEALGVTVLEMGPCTLIRKKTSESKDGYTALQLGFGKKNPKKLIKAEKGRYKGIGEDNAPAFVKEYRVPNAIAEKYEEGATLSISDLGVSEGDKVDLSGVTIGKGFQGVFRRYNFRGFHETHDHEFRRHGGSIGCRKYPGRVFKGTKMPGRMGGRNRTTQNVKIAKIIPEENLILVNGSVPGAKNSFISLRPAIKIKIKKSTK